MLERTPGNRRVYRRSVLRRLAVIRAGQTIGMSLDEIQNALDGLGASDAIRPEHWEALSRSWRADLDLRIQALTELRDGLDGCIGCGCLSMVACPVRNANDRLADQGAGPRAMPAVISLANNDSGHEPGSRD